MRYSWRLVLATTVLVTGPLAVRADEKVMLSGQIYTADGKQTLSNATVTLLTGRNKAIDHALTDAYGKYTLAVPKSLLRLPVHPHAGGNILGGLFMHGVGTALSMVNPFAGMGFNMASNLIHAVGHHGHTRSSVYSNVDSASTQKTVSQMEASHKTVSPDLIAIAQGDSEALERVTPYATGVLPLHVTLPDHTEWEGLTQVYWLGEGIPTPDGKTRRGMQGRLDPMQVGAATPALNATGSPDPSRASNQPQTAQPQIMEAKHTFYVLREPRIEPAEAEYGQTVELTVRMDTPADTGDPVVVLAHNLKTNQEIELTPQGNSVYSVRIAVDSHTFARNEQTFCILAYAQDADKPGRSKKHENEMRRLGMWKLEKPFVYDPLMEVSRNRVAVRVKVIKKTRESSSQTSMLTRRSAHCQVNSLHSPLTGLVLPDGARPVQDHKALAQTRPALDKLARASGKSIGHLEIYHWTQPEGVESNLDKTLRRTCDLYKKLPEVTKDGSKLQVFIIALKARKLACLGLWLSNDSEFYLAWGQLVTTETNARSTADAPLPDSIDSGQPSPRHALVFPKLTRKPGIVQGTVLNSSGRPMPNVTISAYFAIPSQYLHTADVLKTTSDEHGHYAINVKETVALGHVSAIRRVQYNGMACPLPFMRLDANGHPRDSDVISREEGDVVNFTPAISGLRESDDDPDNWASYFGGMIQVGSDIRNNGHSLPTGSRIRVVLTPKGPLLDGNAGRSLVRDIAVSSTYFHLQWNDIPIGSYLASATLIQPNGTAYPLQATARIWIKGLMHAYSMNADTPLFFPPDDNKFTYIALEIALP